MPEIFDPSSESLKYLLASIHNGEVALPDFQRDFVWDPRATEELIESILQNHPAGSLLRIKNKRDSLFAPRAVEGAPTLDGRSPSYVVLDGQQRLTSLYQALYGAGNHRYFMDLSVLLDDGDLDDCVFFLRTNIAERRFGKIKQQSCKPVLPLKVLFGEDGGFEDWLDDVLDRREKDGAKSKKVKKLRKDLNRIRKNWIKNIEDYRFPVVTLAEETEAEAVCTIFETLNRTGVKLTVFDLLAARFWPEEVRLRDLWEQALTDHPILDDFEVDPYYILQAVSIFTAKAAPSCKRGDVLKMNIGQIQTGWTPVVSGVARMLQMLRDDCGVILPKWLPYNPMLIPAGAVLAKHKNDRGARVAAIRNKMKRWFWCSVFGQAYENAPNSQAVKDFTELTSWFNGGTVPESVRKFTFDSDILLETTVRQRAIYRGCIALVLSSGARDFHSGNPITASMIDEKKIDAHHIFPKGYLADLSERVTTRLQDCVLNRTLIDKDTNIRIGKKAPADYLDEIKAEIGKTCLNKVLRSHLLPSSDDSCISDADFRDFLKKRQRQIAKMIEKVTK